MTNYNYLTSYLTSYWTSYLTSYWRSYVTSYLKSYLTSYLTSYVTSYVTSCFKASVDGANMAVRLALNLRDELIELNTLKLDTTTQKYFHVYGAPNRTFAKKV